MDKREATDPSISPDALRLANERLRHAVRRLEEANRAQEIFLKISREVLMARDEEEVVDLLRDALERLLPSRWFLLRIVEPKTLELTSHRYEGPSEPNDVEVLRLKRSAFVRMGLPERLEDHPRVQILDEYAPVFADGHEGLAMPLVAGGQLVGLINVEYPVDTPFRREEDGLRLRPIANQVGLVLRNVKLLQETLLLKEYQEKLVENANALIVVLNPNRDILVYNRELEVLTGYSKSDVVGTNFLQLLPHEERSRFLRVLINSMRGLPTSNFETRIRNRDGSETRVAINTAPILSPEGEVEAVIAVGQDLTKIKHLEAQVIHAERLATLGQLAAGVVHELNNPLTSITVYGEYLEKKLVADAYDNAEVEKVRKILEGAGRIRSFTRNLISYARPSTSKVTLLNMNDIVRQAISFCEHMLRAAKAKTVVSYAEDLPLIYGVADQLEQVIINLVTNASHAVRETDGGLIEITTGRSGDVVLVDIGDDGVGVREADVKRLFEPFFTTKPPGQGTGLGLPIVKDIVESHGGRVWCQSNPGTATLFRVELPVARETSGASSR